MPRKDGIPLNDQLPASRRLMPYLLGAAGEAWVLAEAQVRVQPALDWIADWNRSHPPELELTLHHVLLRACALTLERHPRLNRFLAGGRYYQRRGIYLSFSAKQAFSESGTMLVFKRRFEPGESLGTMIQELHALTRDRAASARAQEGEDALYLRLPPWLLHRAVGLLGRLDAHGLLPQRFIAHNPLFASLFVANLGSLGMTSVWHHLYRLGNIPAFVAVGTPYEAAVVEQGQVVPARVLSLKWTFDERIEDGFNAGQALGTLVELLEAPEHLG